ncbi:hypothetical protein KO527_05145 [Pseudoalteromonas sp. C2R02]|uniref:hypothetical protein n=1 Tax=Pseudoalteromonas sp. C2R02 TaxID=2841565 RepID=UPI001C099F31|nr:hypothetical protein [Pseudoalteromonas sp. C2R02]MBU2968733.1 hypothetical protein [Pseudoalteromonas sp. C2R02]
MKFITRKAWIEQKARLTLVGDKLSCQQCQGQGEAQCNCDCPHCQGYIHCVTCDGEGKFTVKEAHEQLSQLQTYFSNTSFTDYLDEIMQLIKAWCDWCGCEFEALKQRFKMFIEDNTSINAFSQSEQKEYFDNLEVKAC